MNWEDVESVVMYDEKRELVYTEVLERDRTCKNKRNGSLTTCWN